MNKKTINSKAFDKACKKAGLEINTKSRIAPPKGIIINDDIGNKYTITSDSNIVKVERIESKIIKSYNQRMVARRKSMRATRGKVSKVQHPMSRMRKNKITESKG